MNRLLFISLFFLILASGAAAERKQLVLERSGSVEVVLEGDQYVTYVVDDVKFTTRTATIFCDSAIWRRGVDVNLKGNVRIEDDAYQLAADSVYYGVKDELSEAWGKQVELWSYNDSIYAVGTHAFYRSLEKYFFMDERPLLYLRYPDSSRMVEILGDTIEYDADSGYAVSIGDVNITSQDITTRSGRADMDLDTHNLLLTLDPVAIRRNSQVSGAMISVNYHDEVIESIIVTDSASGVFSEPVDSAGLFVDESRLEGDNIVFQFDRGELNHILCFGQAYSWYYPSDRGTREYNENSVSGDTIRFVVSNEELQSVQVTGGAIGTYISGKLPENDSVLVSSDTIDYQSEYIDYSLADSTIILKKAAAVQSQGMSLTAYDISFDTHERIVEAYSAEVQDIDSMAVDSTDPNSMAQLQPNNIPVLLDDGGDVLVGDYLRYSIDTRKGRIVKSKTEYDLGYYYGGKLFREQENIAYIDDGRFTTCNAPEPHFHFHSKNLKLIEGDKMIARPVVFYIGRLPVLALPYYVFPLKKGRRSGILTFGYGNFQRGDRQITDLGYYWAPSDYFDWTNSVDYIENNSSFKFKSEANFAKRYYITNTRMYGEYLVETDYSTTKARESKHKRWFLEGSYNHQITPTFKIAATGKIVSDENYFSDYSNNLDDRLSKSMNSQASIAKQFANGISISSTFKHYVDLQNESRTDEIPSATISLPLVYPFGNGSRDADGNVVQKWYHGFKLQYSPSLLNSSTRVTEDSVYTWEEQVDSLLLDDSTYVYDTLVQHEDTLSYRSRKHYAKIQHSPTLYLPQVTLGNYLKLNPSFGYRETWIKIYETDQSRDAGIEADNYRTYSWNASIKATTTLYGRAIYPNILGVTALRHVVTPSVTYAYTPDVNRHETIRSFAGGGAGSSKSQTMTFGIDQRFQSKVKSGETESSGEWLSLVTSFSKDFEKEDHPWSNITTNYQLKAIPGLTFNGTMIHTPYNPETDELNFLDLYMQSFSLNTSLNLHGRFPFFDDANDIPRGADSASQAGNSSGKESKGSWTCNLYYQYAESGRGTSWSKTNDVLKASITIQFNLTRNTSVSLSNVEYNFRTSKLVSTRIQIVRQLHCWTGSLYWAPVGSNPGFGFKLYVTAMPDIKIDNNHETSISSLTNR
ncbi:MAG TPA: putative LPS assembly protein LptD [candidate division Zixibacteria bacterium]|nr:putative LPS assembly protein LptD [candidate division Zixibacteria bacterium]